MMEYFNTGTVKFENGSKVGDLILNYDLLTDNLITKRFEKDYIVDKRVIDGFSFYDPKTSKAFVFKKIETGDGFFFGEELYACSMFTLYKKNALRLQVSAPQAGYGSDNFKEKKYTVDESAYYILKQDSVLIEVDKKSQALKDFIITIQDDTEAELKTFQKLKVNPSSQDKIISFFKLLCQ